VRYQTALRPESRLEYALTAKVSMRTTFQFMQYFFEFHT